MSESIVPDQQDIEVSTAAVQRIKNILKNSGHTPKTARIRVSVESGGCSGLTYKLDIEEKHSVSTEAADQLFLAEDLEILVDMRSFLYLAGTRLEFSEGLHGKGFTFENPNASRTCSCGESFSL